MDSTQLYASSSKSSLKKRKSPDGAGPNISTKKRRKSDSTDDTDCEFHVASASLILSIPPTFAANPRIGAEEMLDSMVMRYIPAFQGVVLAHSNLKFQDQNAIIKMDCPFLVCSVSFDATVWSPRVGMKLVGKVNLCSPDHISLLVHRTFNVSIPRHHIPADEWDFEYGPAENDPEYGQGAQENNDEMVADNMTKKQNNDGGGKWVRRITGHRIGNKDGFLEFTVVGLTVANEMLSLLGSIQPDPFSPEHTIRPQSKKEIHSEVEEDVVEEKSELDDGIDDDSDEDTFTMLGKQADQAALREAKRKAKEDQEKPEKKKKRKDGESEMEFKKSKKHKKR
ncbi:uncharacterized protein LACBIDRAFT_293037 [Laccaria bicolor S238N-H82]|uniref:Predicted protein n=1 Tax=Laccaria bicolor (strain S238N-H82 / ATCC MYA-4686) TaxID=486041 RepID=B0D0C4_LACBS|nr:uncharacterized protein LACBIDRAFT_293037 [Laccaria bicolor S238N-H82]EDR11429.1 predicted protein [Laccaria bicolor S238N-H82]|eukprot:XP_001877326.1 predicted protein [Laccaria bicolor S238N-H82]